MTATAPNPADTYEGKLAALRARLNGRAYCRPIKGLLPSFSEAKIRNLANGKGESTLFLSALEIVVHQMEADEKKEQERLTQEARRLGIAA
jgi:hypothetical protein